ncbi:MAG TPA: phosphoribosylamine--glycine ligase [Candidatus Brocadiia bacterium]|nr:phosphoribosylamine--glycine ligase [Candidatus Brocadiia bacterium]
MRILVVGSGGREHALVWKIAQSPLVTKVYAAPGNPGAAQHAECVPINAEDVPGIVQFAREQKIDLAVIGPENPLAAGVVDELTSRGIAAFGPSKAAAELEGSKAFAKEIMRKNGIPTAPSRSFKDEKAAHAYINESEGPLVVKADGLAAGKGVIVCQTPAEAHEAVVRVMGDREFGGAGETLIIEERLYGQEASLLAFTDGKTIMPMEPAQDHKPVFDGDAGDNTGGMGAYSPAPIVTPAIRGDVERRVLVPAIHGMNREGRRFRGVLYAGLMITRAGPMVLEFNARFGDPETQPLLMRMKSDIVPILLACARGGLEKEAIEWRPEAAVCVVMASGGYPRSYEKGFVIEGLEDAAKMEGVMVFHAGTRMSQNRVISWGGRVLGVTALGAGIAQAQKRAYEAVSKINFSRCHYRRDIASKAIQV